jgi:adenylate cyclase
MMIISIILTIITVLCYFFLPRVLSLIFAWATMLSTLWLARYIYDIHRLVIDIFPLFLSVFLATFTMTYFYRFFVVDKEKRYIENAFGHYIDPKMVEMIDMEEVAVSLWGEQRELSVFFSDIAGFTTISEKLSPENLFWLMSLYLSRMTDILKVEWGTLDKYIGDAVMWFFGAPVGQSDHAMRACKTAVAMRKALPELNDLIAERGIMRVDFRIGISSGDVMVGNIGSIEHFNYTVLGDTVNLASRLEATGKEYEVHIIISEWTREKIGERFELRELDTIAVKWKEKWVKIYELLGNIGDVKDREVYTKYEQALALYRKWKYIEAGKIWETQMNQDPPSRIMVMRCIEILKWNISVENGIFHMTHK